MTLSDLFEVLTPSTRVVVQFSVNHTQPCELADFPETNYDMLEDMGYLKVAEVWYNNLYEALWIEVEVDSELSYMKE